MPLSHQGRAYSYHPSPALAARLRRTLNALERRGHALATHNSFVCAAIAQLLHRVERIHNEGQPFPATDPAPSLVKPRQRGPAQFRLKP